MSPRQRWQTKTGRCLDAACLGMALLAVAALGTSGMAASPASAAEVAGLELSPTVQRNLGRLQDDWQAWTQAFAQNDREAADTALQSLGNVATFLGMAHLPDLSSAAAALAVDAAKQEDFTRAGWALEAATQLDPSRPETEIARAVVQRLEGNFVGSLASRIRADLMVFRDSTGRILQTQNLGLWALSMMLLSGGFFVVLLIALKGSSLFYDLGRLVSPPFPRTLQDLAAVLLLVWPLFLPSGILWLGLYWSILIWGYCRATERTVLILLWATIGVMPLVANHQRRAAQLELMPPVQAMEDLAAGRLSSRLFNDLEAMRTLIPDDPAVTEIYADLHRRFRQWDSAERIYSGLYEDADEDNFKAPARNNLGVNHHRRGDYKTAIEYFQQATQLDDGLAAAWFNLSEACAKTYDFTCSHEAVARAKEIDPTAVDSWQATVAESGGAIAVDGGLMRASELRATLRDLGRNADDPVDLTRRYLSVGVAVAALVLAVLLDLLMSRRGHPSARFSRPSGESVSLGARLFHTLVPGWSSLRSGNGGKAFLGILLPMSLLAILLTRIAGYRSPLGFDPGPGAASTLAILLLVILLLLRAALAFSKKNA